MRILFLPVYDPSHHAVAVANKHGLRDALIAAGNVVREVDYCAIEPHLTASEIWRHLDEFKPDMVLSQFQGVDRMNGDQLRAVRASRSAMWVNFNQDYWPEHHTTPDMLNMLRHVDLQLVSNGSVLPDYTANGVNAAYWPFGYETPVRPYPEVPAHDVVFLGNAYSEHRRKLGKLLKSLPYNVGLYGTGWENGDGDCNYDFTYGEALYRKAKIAISDNEFLHADGYISNRPFQILAAGGALMAHQHSHSVYERTGITPSVHYAPWFDLEGLVHCINYWLTKDWVQKDKQRITLNAQQFVREHHSYDVRVRELMAMVEGLKV